MHPLVRHLLPTLLLAGAAPALVAQDAAGAAPAHAPVRNATVAIGVISGISPFFAVGAEALAHLRVHSHFSVHGNLGVASRVVAAGTFDERGIVRAGWHGGVRFWPQGRALEGWGVGIAYGRAVHEVIGDRLQNLFEDRESATLSRLTVDVGHQWLLRRSRRLVAFANAAVSRNGQIAGPSRLVVPRIDALVSLGVGLAF